MEKFPLLLLSAVFVAGCSHEQALTPRPTQVEGQSVLTADEVKFLAEVQTPVKFNQEEVDRIALDAAGFLDAVSPSTRSAGRTVAKVSPIFGDVSGDATRADSGTEEADGAEELFYAVDFAEGEGYALISADRRLPDEVLVNVGSGSFPEGEIENPGFALMMEGAENYASREIARYEAHQDSIEIAMLTRLAEENPELAESIEKYLASIGDGGSQPKTRALIGEQRPPLMFVDIRYEYGPWTTAQHITPMIPVEWGQGAPFNDLVEAGYDPGYLQSIHDNNGDYIPAGCVAIAVAQLMTFWEYPETLQGTTIDWDELQKWSGNNSDYSNGYKTWSGRMSSLSSVDLTRKMCNRLISWIGLQTDMNYGVNASNTTSRKAMSLLKDLGFNAPSRHGYDTNSVKNAILAGRPVYIGGYSHMTSVLGIPLIPSGGHDWLIDGYLKQRRTVTVTRIYELQASIGIDPDQFIDLSGYTTTSTETHTRQFFHNNFGWGGVDNGYYVCGMFDANNNPDLPSNTRSGEDKNYVYGLDVWTEITH